MTITEDKARLTELLDDSQRDMLALVQPLNQEQMIYAGGGWRVKDIIAHILAWEEKMTQSLQAYRDGGEYRFSDFATDDDANEYFFRQHHDDPSDAIYTNWAALRTRFKALINELSPTQFEGVFVFPWGERQTITYLIKHDLIPHVQGHRVDIQKVLAGE